MDLVVFSSGNSLRIVEGKNKNAKLLFWKLKLEKILG
jgi:hypothetical protein